MLFAPASSWVVSAPARRAGMRVVARSRMRMFPLSTPSVRTMVRDSSRPAAPELLALPAPTLSAPALPAPALAVPVAPEGPRRTRFWLSSCRRLAPLMRLYDKYAWYRLRRHGFTSSFIDTPEGVSIHAIRAPGQGKRPPLVFIHGLSSSAATYYDLLLRLQKDFREVLAIDLPGHGLSVPYPSVTVPSFLGAARAALDGLIQTPSVVLGHSLGGFVATHYAYASPQKVAGLVLAAPAGGPVSEATRQELMRLFEVRTHRDARTLAMRTFAPPSWRTELFAAGTTTRFLDPAMQLLVHSSLATQRLSRRMLSGLQVPTLLVWGQNEKLIPPEHLDYFRTYLPPGTLTRMLPGVNHSSIANAPSPVVGELLRFAQRRRVLKRTGVAMERLGTPRALAS